MQPNQPLPTDYLDAIAPKTSKKLPMNSLPMKLLAVGIVLIILVLILAAVVNAVNATRKGPAETLVARMSATSTIVTDSQSKLKSSQLRSLNSNLSLFFTNTNRDIAAPLAAIGVDVAAIPERVTTEETATATTLSERLEEGRLNAAFDRTYAFEMDYQLSTILTVMQELYNNTSNESLRTFLDTTYKSLQPTQQDFADFIEGS